jgi:hypothetical protein
MVGSLEGEVVLGIRRLIWLYRSVREDVAALEPRAEERPRDNLDGLSFREEGSQHPSHSPPVSEGLAGRQALRPHRGLPLGVHGKHGSAGSSGPGGKRGRGA